MFVAATKCPSCESVFLTPGGLRKHAGLVHHLKREGGRWKQIRGKEAQELVAKLKSQGASTPSATSSSRSSRSETVPSFPPPIITTESSPTHHSVPSPVKSQSSIPSVVPPCSSSQLSVAGSAHLPSVSSVYVSDPRGLSVSPSNLFAADPVLTGTGALSDIDDFRESVAAQAASASVVYSEREEPLLPPQIDTDNLLTERDNIVAEQADRESISSYSSACSRCQHKDK